MAKYKIETDRPLPRVKAHYPFNEMSVGESFLVEAIAPDIQIRLQRRLFSASYAWAKKFNRGARFVTKCEMNNSVRIWRIK